MDRHAGYGDANGNIAARHVRATTGDERVARLLIIADEPLFGRGLALLLADCGEPYEAICVESLARTRRLLGCGRPEAVLWCGDCLDAATLDALSGLRRVPGEPGLCVLANRADHVAVRRLVADSACGFAIALRERRPDLSVIRAMLDGVLVGEAVLEPRVLERILAEPDGDDLLANLTAAELEVLNLIAAGLRNRAIGARLQKSERAIEKHVSQIFAKLGLRADADDQRDRRVSAARMFLERVDARSAPPSG